jgi:hypothetical protein
MGKRISPRSIVLTLTLLFAGSLTACGSDDEETPSKQQNASADCTGLCGRIVPLGCSKGPPSAELCGLVCQGNLDGTNEACKTAFRDLLDCVQPTSTITCDAEGQFTSADCAAEWQASVPCVPQI